MAVVAAPKICTEREKRKKRKEREEKGKRGEKGKKGRREQEEKCIVDVTHPLRTVKKLKDTEKGGGEKTGKRPGDRWKKTILSQTLCRFYSSCRKRGYYLPIIFCMFQSIGLTQEMIGLLKF